MEQIDLIYRTTFAELMQRSMDAAFTSEFDDRGWFVTVPVKGRSYFYFETLDENGATKRAYVGPKDDDEIARRVAHHKTLKAEFKSRRKLVTTLTRHAGLMATDRVTGDVIEALADAGFFRLRGVLVGTVAFQCYPGVLGVRMPRVAMQTGDADFAVGDTLPPVLDVFRKVDPTFREIPHSADGRLTAAYESASKFRVEFLTPNRGSDDNQNQPAHMPALGGASAAPLRFLDFLIHEPMRSVLLHKSGIPVTIPSPERFAIHKLIVATRRQDDDNGRAKRSKDVEQAVILTTAMGETRQQSDLALAFTEAWSRGPAWRSAIKRGVSFMSPGHAETFKRLIFEGLRDIGEDPGKFDL